jgi:hypothetical protein
MAGRRLRRERSTGDNEASEDERRASMYIAGV